MPAAERRCRRGVQHDGSPALEHARAQRRERLRQGEDRADRLGQPLLADVHGDRDELVTALVGHAQGGSVDAEGLYDRARDGVERVVEREVLGEGARDLVQRAEALGRLEGLVAGALRILRFLGELLMEARVLDRDRELRRERPEQRFLVLGQLAALLGVGGEQADHLVAGAERNADRSLDAKLLDGAAHAGEANIARRVGQEHQSAAARGAERELEQALADSHVRAREAALRCGLEPVVFDEVDGQPLCRQQLPHAFDGGLERVRERELGDRLADDREERLGALEVLGKRPAAFAGTERVRGADGEGGEPRQQRAVGIRCLREDELKGAQRRLPELKGGEGAHAVVERVHRDGLARLVGPPRRVERRHRGRSALRPRDSGQQRVAVILVAPHEADQGSGGLGRERSDVVGGPGLVGARGKCVPGKLDRVGRGVRGVGLGKCPAGERDVVGSGASQRALALVEGLAAPQQLEGSDKSAVAAYRQVEDADRRDPIGNETERRRQQVELRVLFERDRGGVDSRTFELCPDRLRWSMYGVRGQGAVLVGKPRDDEVRLSELGRPLRDRREGLVEARGSGRFSGGCHHCPRRIMAST